MIMFMSQALTPHVEVIISYLLFIPCGLKLYAQFPIMRVSVPHNESVSGSLCEIQSLLGESPLQNRKVAEYFLKY